MPTLADFIQQVVVPPYDCKEAKVEGMLMGPDGKNEILYLTREVEGETLHVIQPILEDDEALNPSMVRNMCNRLQIPTALFGFEFEEDSGFDSDNTTH